MISTKDVSEFCLDKAKVREAINKIRKHAEWCSKSEQEKVNITFDMLEKELGLDDKGK